MTFIVVFWIWLRPW